MNDEYRSLCYMRPLAIWSIQWALTRTQSFGEEKEKLVKGEEEESDLLLRQHKGFKDVARFVKIVPTRNEHRSRLQHTYEAVLNILRL